MADSMTQSARRHNRNEAAPDTHERAGSLIGLSPNHTKPVLRAQDRWLNEE